MVPGGRAPGGRDRRDAMKTYTGLRYLPSGRVVVTVKDPARIPPIHAELVPIRSPGAFEWGYAGSGPHELALAILGDYFGEDPAGLRQYAKTGRMGSRCGVCHGEGWIEEKGDRYDDAESGPLCEACDGLGMIIPPVSRAWHLHNDFAHQVIAGLDKDKWELTGTEIATFVQVALAAHPIEQDY